MLPCRMVGGSTLHELRYRCVCVYIYIYIYIYIYAYRHITYYVYVYVVMCIMCEYIRIQAISQARIPKSFRALFARIRRLRKSPQYLLVILQGTTIFSANLRNAAQNFHNNRADIAINYGADIAQNFQYYSRHCNKLLRIIAGHSTGKDNIYIVYIYIYMYVCVYIYIYIHTPYLFLSANLPNSLHNFTAILLLLLFLLLFVLLLITTYYYYYYYHYYCRTSTTVARTNVNVQACVIP